MKSLKSMIFILILVTAGHSSAQIRHYNVDIEESELIWKAKKVGGKHEGLVSIKSGYLIMSDNKLKGGQFIVDMTTIKCTDLRNENSNSNLVTHLNSDDFFSVANYSTAEFKITTVISQWANNYQIIGKITIKNITKDITFLAEVNPIEDKISATATISVDRTEFDIHHRSGKFFKNLGDNAINDIFEIEISLLAYPENKN